MENVRILLVEDDQLLSTFLQYKLVRGGFVVTSASNGEDALAELERGSFEIVLLDIMLPRMNGLQLMQRVSEAPELQPGVWVVLSSLSSEEDQLRAFELGAADYITKPFSMDVLLARIKAAMRFKSNVRGSSLAEPTATGAAETAEVRPDEESQLKRRHAPNL